MEKVRFKKAKLISLTLLFISFSCFLFIRFGSSTEDKIDSYFIKNKNSFILLKNEVLNIKGNFMNRNTGNLLQKAETNRIVDSLKMELNISYIGLSFDKNLMPTIHFEVDLNNYMDTFEIWYSEEGLNEFSDRDQVLSLKKIDNSWGIFRNRRKRDGLF